MIFVAGIFIMRVKSLMNISFTAAFDLERKRGVFSANLWLWQFFNWLVDRFSVQISKTVPWSYFFAALRVAWAKVLALPRVRQVL